MRYRVCLEEAGPLKVEVEPCDVSEIVAKEIEIKTDVEDIVNIADNIEVAINDADVLNNLQGVVDPNPSMESLKILMLTVENIKHRLGYKTTSFACESIQPSIALESTVADIWEKIKSVLSFLWEKIKEFFAKVASFFNTAKAKNRKQIERIKAAIDAGIEAYNISQEDAMQTARAFLNKEVAVYLSPDEVLRAGLVYHVGHSGIDTNTLKESAGEVQKFFSTWIKSMKESIHASEQNFDAVLKIINDYKTGHLKSEDLKKAKDDLQNPYRAGNTIDSTFGKTWNVIDDAWVESSYVKDLLNEKKEGYAVTKVHFHSGTDLLNFTKYSSLIIDDYDRYCKSHTEMYQNVERTFNNYINVIDAALKQVKHDIEQKFNIDNGEVDHEKHRLALEVRSFIHRHLLSFNATKRLVVNGSITPLQMYSAYVKEMIQLTEKAIDQFYKQQ